MFNFINNVNNRNNQPIRRVIQNNLRRGDVPPPLETSRTVALFSQPYLDTYNQCYKNIVVSNLKPEGPLGDLVKFIRFPPLSEFKEPAQYTTTRDCGYALMSFGAYSSCSKIGNDLMVVDEVPDLISYLLSAGYKVDTSITKMFNASDIRFNTNNSNKLICIITYIG